MREVYRQARLTPAGFSLVEVILAIGVFAFSIVAIVGLLSTASQSTSEVLDTATASRIADGVRSELDGVPLGALDGMTGNMNNPLTLVATKDGERVRISGGPGVGSPNADNDPEMGDPPGIADRDRFYLIEIVQLETTLPTYDPNSAMIPLSLRVIWPHHQPTGLGDSDFSIVTAERQSMAIFNTAILRKE